MKRNKIITLIIQFFIGFIIGGLVYLIMSRIEPNNQIVIHRTYLIDSTQVQVVYTDTWGKIFVMKEEDL